MVSVLLEWPTYFLSSGIQEIMVVASLFCNAETIKSGAGDIVSACNLCV
jgi:hypothetical protein